MLNFVIAAVRGSTRRVPRLGASQLNSKRGPRNYYKGKGARAVGRHTSKGQSGSTGVPDAQETAA